MNKLWVITILLKIPKNNIPFEMNKLLVITGGSKGIGRKIIERFIKEGFDVATCSRHNGDLEKLKADIKHPGNLLTLAADLTDRKAITHFIQFITELNRPVDVLINNAGFFVPGEISTEEEGVLESMIQANLLSAYHITRGILPQMKLNKRGHIFNMCSIASLKAYKNGGSYAITKFALLGFSKCLREELKDMGIRVTAIMPGATLTASWEGVNLPEDRFMKPEDIADMVYASYALSSRSVVEEIIIRPQLGDI
jgi:short-subunit dehydrogenase